MKIYLPIELMYTFHLRRDGTRNDTSIATMDIFQRDSKVTGKAVGNTIVSATLVDIEGTAPVTVQ